MTGFELVFRMTAGWELDMNLEYTIGLDGHRLQIWKVTSMSLAGFHFWSYVFVVNCHGKWGCGNMVSLCAAKFTWRSMYCTFAGEIRYYWLCCVCGCESLHRTFPSSQL